MILFTDMYIKAWCYALWAKIGFGITIILSTLLILWPVIVMFLEKYLEDQKVFDFTVIQTTATAFAAFSYGLYRHYKKRQVAVEGLMRVSITADPKKYCNLFATIPNELERLDQGFSFTQTKNKN